MAKKNKYYDSRNQAEPANTAPEMQTPAKPKPVKVEDNSFKPFNQPAINPLAEQTKVMFGTDQDIDAAPMTVPTGFATEITYQSGVNSTLIANPLLIPLQTLYKIATTEPTCAADMTYWTVVLMKRLKDYDNPVEKYQDHCRESMHLIGFNKLKRAMATSFYYGFSAVKWIWGKSPTTGRDMIVDFVHLPQASVQFAVTPQGKLDENYGVLHRYYGLINNTQNNSNFGNGSGSFNVGGSDVPPRVTGVNLTFVAALPKLWRMVMTFNPRGYNGNHYGEPFLKVSYPWVVSKYASWAKVETSLTFKAFPLNIIETNTETTVTYKDGSTASAQQDLLKNMGNAMSTGILVTGYGLNSINVHTIDNSADVEKMMRPIEMCDYQIRVAHCSNDYVGNSGTFASAKVNSDSHKDVKNSIIMLFADTLMEQYIKYNLQAGFGQDIEDYGCFSLADDSLDDQLKWADLYQKAQASGSYDPTDIEQLNYAQHKQGIKVSDKITSSAMLGLTDNTGGDLSAVKETLNEPYSKGLDADAKTDE